MEKVNQFQTAWIMGGFILGYFVPQLILLRNKIRTNFLCDLGFAFVGGLIAYTIVK